MAEDVTNTGQESENNGENGQEPTPKTYGEDYVKQLRAEAAGWRTKAQGAEAKVTEFENAQKTETQRLKDEAAAAKAQVAEAKATAKQALANAEIARYAAQSGIDVSLAQRLVDVQFDADDKPTGVEDAIKSLISNHPNLAAGYGNSAANPGRTSKLTIDEIKRMTPEQVLARQDEVNAVLAAQR